jgi:hypothetical protein
LFVADSEARDGHVIGGAVAGQDPESDVLGAAPLDLAGGTDPVAGPAVAIGSVGLEEWAKVELVDDVEDEPGQVIGRQPVAQVGWEQEGLVAVAGKEVVGHGRSYAISLLCYHTTDPVSSRCCRKVLRVNPRCAEPHSRQAADPTPAS